jgi:pimeloyl-ACP methyl ester carboxylesterase
VSVPLPIWQEVLAGVSRCRDRLSPRFAPFSEDMASRAGTDPAAVPVPGFLGSDFYLTQLRSWLRRIGYNPRYSGIGLNAKCPNLLIRLRLNETIREAYKSTRRKVHLIGHSLGGTIARPAASQVPDRIASVITLRSPIRGLRLCASPN